MNQVYLLQRAQQRDPHAIATLLNYSLEGRRVKVIEAAINDNCLFLKLQSRRVPNHYELVPFIRDEIKSLGVELIKKIQISGLTFVSKCPAWEKSILLEDDLFLVDQINCCAKVKPNHAPYVKVKSTPRGLNKKKNPFPRKPVFLKSLLLTSLLLGCGWAIIMEVYSSFPKNTSPGEQTAFFIPFK